MAELNPGWKRVRFCDVVRQVKDKVDPATSGLKRFVAGEHMDTDELRIRRWGDIDDGYLGPAFNMRFKPGQVLYGSRRTYLRKVAIASFEGICANTTFILESTNPNELLPELLPFVMSTEAFHEHSKRESKGSVNPYVNFSDLAWYEFSLPPLEEQNRLLAAAASTQELCDVIDEAEVAARNALEALLQAEMGSISTRSPLQTACLPIVRGIDSPGPDTPGGVPYVRIAEMTGSDEIIVERLLRTSQKKANAQPQSRLEAGDMVVALRGVVGLPVWVPSSAAGANLSRGTARVSVEKEHNPRFVYWALKSSSVKREVLRTCTGWKGEDLREITLGSLRNLMIPLPKREVQDAVTCRIEAAALCHKSLSVRKNRAKEFHRMILGSLQVGCGS